MTPEERLSLIKEVGEEIIEENELLELLKNKKKLIAYDGFEPSGRMHIAQGVLRVINVNKMVKAGCKFIMLVADWHSWANNKLEGDLDKIHIAGEYFIEIWKACGMDTKNVEFVWASDLLDNKEYWKTVMQIATKSTVSRIIRCCQIMGRDEKEQLYASQIFYPCMQAADIFHLKADICQLGMDQRKVNILARELGEKLGYWKPIIVSHHMLMGLSEPPKTNESAKERAITLKMSKSKPETALFMDDSEEDVKNKIKKAYCPEKQIKENPILEYYKYILFERYKKIEIERPEKFGGNVAFNNYQDLEKAYENGSIHPADLKSAAAKYINELLEPVRKHFSSGEQKKLMEKVKSFRVTR